MSEEFLIELYKELIIYFDALGLTAWAEDTKGSPIPSAIVYEWAWINFYPNTIVFCVFLDKILSNPNKLKSKNKLDKYPFT